MLLNKIQHIGVSENPNVNHLVQNIISEMVREDKLRDRRLLYNINTYFPMEFDNNIISRSDAKNNLQSELDYRPDILDSAINREIIKAVNEPNNENIILEFIEECESSQMKNAKELLEEYGYTKEEYSSAPELFLRKLKGINSMMYYIRTYGGAYDQLTELLQKSEIEKYEDMIILKEEIKFKYIRYSLNSDNKKFFYGLLEYPQDVLMFLKLQFAKKSLHISYLNLLNDDQLLEVSRKNSEIDCLLRRILKDNSDNLMSPDLYEANEYEEFKEFLKKLNLKVVDRTLVEIE